MVKLVIAVMTFMLFASVASADNLQNCSQERAIEATRAQIEASISAKNAKFAVETQWNAQLMKSTTAVAFTYTAQPDIFTPVIRRFAGAAVYGENCVLESFVNLIVE